MIERDTIGLNERPMSRRISGAFLFLAANEGSVLVIGRDAIRLNERPMSRRISGAFFYLAANEDLGRFVLPRC